MTVLGETNSTSSEVDELRLVMSELTPDQKERRKIAGFKFMRGAVVESFDIVKATPKAGHSLDPNLVAFAAIDGNGVVGLVATLEAEGPATVLPMGDKDFSPYVQGEIQGAVLSAASNLQLAAPTEVRYIPVDGVAQQSLAA